MKWHKTTQCWLKERQSQVDSPLLVFSFWQKALTFNSLPVRTAAALRTLFQAEEALPKLPCNIFMIAADLSTKRPRLKAAAMSELSP